MNPNPAHTFFLSPISGLSARDNAGHMLALLPLKPSLTLVLTLDGIGVILRVCFGLVKRQFAFSHSADVNYFLVDKDVGVGAGGSAGGGGGGRGGGGGDGDDGVGDDMHPIMMPLAWRSDDKSDSRNK